MANGSSRVLLVILGLALGFAAGRFFRPTVSTPTDTHRQTIVAAAKPWKIKIGPDACTLSDLDQGEQQITVPTPVSKKTGDNIVWRSHNKKDKIYIVLHVPLQCDGQPPPFKNAVPLAQQDAQGRDLYLIDNGSPSVDSGPVDPNACETQIKYDQFLQIEGKGLFYGCDGMIIIDK
jgi:hypothetical protein